MLGKVRNKLFSAQYVTGLYAAPSFIAENTWAAIIPLNKRRMGVRKDLGADTDPRGVGLLQRSRHSKRKVPGY